MRAESIVRARICELLLAPLIRSACRATARIAPTLDEQGFQPSRVGAGQPRPGDDEGSPRPGGGVGGGWQSFTNPNRQAELLVGNFGARLGPLLGNLLGVFPGERPFARLERLVNDRLC